jgi:hypothetical protein
MGPSLKGRQAHHNSLMDDRDFSNIFLVGGGDAIRTRDPKLAIVSSSRFSIAPPSARRKVIVASALAQKAPAEDASTVMVSLPAAQVDGTVASQLLGPAASVDWPAG